MGENDRFFGNFFKGNTTILFFIILFLLIFWGSKGAAWDNDL